MLERAEVLKRKLTASSIVSVPPAEAKEPTVTLPLDPEQPTPVADILEMSLVECGGPLNLNPFPSDDKEELVGDARYTRSTLETETVSQVTTEAYVHVPAQDVPASTSEVKAAKKAPRKKVPSKVRP